MTVLALKYPCAHCIQNTLNFITKYMILSPAKINRGDAGILGQSCTHTRGSGVPNVVIVNVDRHDTGVLGKQST